MKYCKSVALLNAETNISLFEDRILSLAISKIQNLTNSEVVGKKIIITALEFCELFGSDLDRTYKNFNKNVSFLKDKKVEIDGKTIKWFSDVEKEKNKGGISLVFSKEILPHIKPGFYEIETIEF